MRRSILVVPLLVGVSIAGCGSHGSSPSAALPGAASSLQATSQPSASPTPVPTARPSRAAATATRTPTTRTSALPTRRTPTKTVRAAPRSAPVPTKVLVFVEENHSASEALAGMPYLASLARTYGRTTAYRAVTHPSLPNYLALAGGSTFGVHDDAAPASHPLSGDSVFDEALARNRAAKTYAEAMPGNCALSSSGSYAVKHNPWAYFSGSVQRANCRRFDVPMGTPSGGALAHDIANGVLPRVGMAIPDLCHDAHDCSLSTADSWLHTWIRAVMAGPDYRSGRLAIMVTFDEDDSSAGNNVLTVVVSPRTRGVTSSAPYNHYSMLRCTAELAGIPALRNASGARSLCPAFHL